MRIPLLSAPIQLKRYTLCFWMYLLISTWAMLYFTIVMHLDIGNYIFVDTNMFATFWNKNYTTFFSKQISGYVSRVKTKKKFIYKQKKNLFYSFEVQTQFLHQPNIPQFVNFDNYVVKFYRLYEWWICSWRRR